MECIMVLGDTGQLGGGYGTVESANLAGLSEAAREFKGNTQKPPLRSTAPSGVALRVVNVHTHLKRTLWGFRISL